MRMANVTLVALAAVLWLAPAVGQSDDLLRGRVLAFARANLGKTVGNGECSALAVQALKAAGARPRAERGFPTSRDYVWGELVLLIEASPAGSKLTGSINDVRPGDIAQFSNARFVTAHYAHHTAIVADINGKHLTLLQQNIAGQQAVFQGAVRIDKLSTGWVRFYRPVPLG